MRITRLVVCFALTACQSSPIVPTATLQGNSTSREAPDAASRAHLYASVATASHYPSIERFRLVKGIPEKSPDRVYRGYGGLLAVAGDGTLYAANSVNDITIDVFPPNATKPERQIVVPNIATRCKAGSGGATATLAIAADARGYLFVGMYVYGGATPDFRLPCKGVAIFAPGAKGKARPVQVVRYRGASVLSLAVDSADNLYVANDPATVYEFANAVSDPTLTRVFHGKYIGDDLHAIATDAAGNVFIAGTDDNYQNGIVDRYAPTAKGRGAPTSAISLPPGVHLLPSIAANGRVVYVDDVYSSVELYHALKKGPQSPFYSLPAPNVSSIAVGP